MGSKCNVYGIIRQRQTGPVVVILRTEADHTTYAGRGCFNHHRGIRSFIAGDEIQGVQTVEKREGRKGAPAGIWTRDFRRTDHIYRVARGINHGCSGNPYLRIDIAKAAEARVADVIPNHRLLSSGSTM